MNSGKYSGGQGPEFGVKQFKAEFWFPGSRIRKPELKSDSVINYNLIDSAVCIKEEWEDQFYWFPRDAMRNKWYKITKCSEVQTTVTHGGFQWCCSSDLSHCCVLAQLPTAAQPTGLLNPGSSRCCSWLSSHLFSFLKIYVIFKELKYSWFTVLC